ncbi:MAG: putative transposase [Myxococcota bacterium]|jgi:putative transposase
MTPPRHILPGKIWFLTRRTHGRRFRLRPCAFLVQLFVFVLFYYAKKYDIGVVGYCCQSNHYHMVIVDRSGRLPEFARDFNAFIARALNAKHKIRDSLWSGDGLSAIALVTPEEVVRKLAYTAANPVAAGAVRFGRDWPGPRSHAGYFCRTTTSRRPEFFVRSSSKMPVLVEHKLVVPPTHAHLTPDQFSGIVGQAIGKAETAARQERDASGLGFLGAEACLDTDPHQAPTVPEPARRSRPGPISEPDREKRQPALEQVLGFRRRYRERRHEWLSGDRTALWPSGTWKMVAVHASRSHPPPIPSPVTVFA